MLNKVKTIIQGIKLNAKYLFGIKDDNNDLIIKPEEINSEGYVIRHNTMMLFNSNVSIAGCCIVKIGFRQVPCIFTDNMFKELSKEAQQFVIQHELGHFHLHNDILLNGFERNDNMEFEADEYSANIIGIENAIKALEELKELISIVTFRTNNIAVSEFDRRINNLKKLVNNI